jgi:hypothetical protein
MATFQNSVETQPILPWFPPLESKECISLTEDMGKTPGKGILNRMKV